MKKTDYTPDEMNILIKKILLKSDINIIYLDKIKKFLIFLLNKNLELNLISRKLTLNEIIYDHFYDCIVCWKFFKEYSSITDLGSGGGLPGLLLSIIFPGKKFYLIEKSKKKALFLNGAVDHLNLKNVIVINNLINEQKIQSEVITCRAFKDINTILASTKNFLNIGGVYILYKGKLDIIKNELLIARKQFNIKTVINKIESLNEKERHIVTIIKNQ